MVCPATGFEDRHGRGERRWAARAPSRTGAPRSRGLRDRQAAAELDVGADHRRPSCAPCSFSAVKETIGCHLLPSSRCRCSNLTIETYASAADETTKIQSSVVAGSGPDIYNLGTTFTPVAYATQGFLTLSEDDWTKIGGRERFLPQTLGMSGPEDGGTELGSDPERDHRVLRSAHRVPPGRPCQRRLEVR